MPSPFRSPATAFALLPLAALCWAGNHVIARAAGGHVPPASMAVGRWTIVALVVLPFALPHLRGDWPKLKSNPGLTVLLAITGGAAGSARCSPPRSSARPSSPITSWASP